MDKLIYSGNRFSKLFGTISFLSLIIAIYLFIVTQFILAVIAIIIAVFSALIGYRLSGSSENLALYSDFDLFDLIAYSVNSGNAKIGFHSTRSQDRVIAALENISISIDLENDPRQEIRTHLTKERRAFDVCRKMMAIQFIHGGKEHFFNGFGQRKTVQFFHEAEIIIDIQSKTKAIITRLMEIVEFSL